MYDRYKIHIPFYTVAAAWRMKLRKHRLHTAYRINNQPYEIFRETQKLSASGETVILVIRFRLKLLRSSRFAHWVFQRLAYARRRFEAVSMDSARSYGWLTQTQKTTWVFMIGAAHDKHKRTSTFCFLF